MAAITEPEFRLEIQQRQLDPKAEARRKALFEARGLNPTRPYRLKEQPTLLAFSGGHHQAIYFGTF